MEFLLFSMKKLRESHFSMIVYFEENPQNSFLFPAIVLSKTCSWIKVSYLGYYQWAVDVEMCTQNDIISAHHSNITFFYWDITWIWLLQCCFHCGITENMWFFFFCQPYWFLWVASEFRTVRTFSSHLCVSSLFYAGVSILVMVDFLATGILVWKSLRGPSYF